MWRILRILFTGDGHLHKWETIRVTKVYAVGREDELPRYNDYECRCTHCGIIKRFRV